MKYLVHDPPLLTNIRIYNAQNLSPTFNKHCKSDVDCLLINNINNNRIT